MTPGSCLSWRDPSGELCLSAADCRFVDAEGFLRLSLAAFYAASRALDRPGGGPWVVDGAGWASPEFFCDELLRGLQDRLYDAAIAAGAADEHPFSDDQGAQGADAPADMGHGWPALEHAGSVNRDLVEVGDAAACKEAAASS